MHTGDMLIQSRAGGYQECVGCGRDDNLLLHSDPQKACGESESRYRSRGSETQEDFTHSHQRRKEGVVLVTYARE